MRTLLATAGRLARGETTSIALVEEALARIADPAGEGTRTFTRVWADAARDFARASDRARAHGVVPSPLAGIPVSVKDLFDVRGEPTPAGSRVLAAATSASEDSPVVARLRAAGAVLVGRTNMTEFAYSGLGLNPHYGTPRNPYDRATGRIPGGSSSGAAVSVTDGMALVGIGTDTGGSVRIPAALCGITGFKPTARRVPRDGVLPLSSTLDSIGPLAPTVACCAVVDAIMAGDAGSGPLVPPALPISGLRFGIVRDYVFDGIDASVASAFDRAIAALARVAKVEDVAFPELARLPALNRAGGFSGAEAFAWHRQLLATRGDEYDPRVSRRIQLAQAMTAADYVDLVRERAAMIARHHLLTAPYDALLMPTVPVIAPVLATLERDDDAYLRANGLILRNPTTINFLDGCALSLPCHRAGEAPVGLMVAGPTGADRRILQVGQAVEAVLAAVTA